MIAADKTAMAVSEVVRHMNRIDMQIALARQAWIDAQVCEMDEEMRPLILSRLFTAYERECRKYDRYKEILDSMQSHR